MFGFFASVFGYLLSFLYNLVNNYGIAILLFTVVIKLLLIPLSYKQQKKMKKTAKIQEKMNVIQFKYKNDPEKMNQEIMNLYKNEKMNPFSGCLTTIIQMLLLLSIFYLVKSPVTYMQKLTVEEQDKIQTYLTQMQESGKEASKVYPEIDLIREYNLLKEKNPEDETVEKFNINMNFLGLDLSKIPQQNMDDYTVYIIPILYIISSFISIKLTTVLQQKQTINKKVIDGKTGKEDESQADTVMQTNKMMSWMMPIMSISIALVAPLGLALYWLLNNVFMILERVILDKAIKPEAEEE